MEYWESCFLGDNAQVNEIYDQFLIVTGSPGVAASVGKAVC
jgi:hypothetical protein